MAAWASRIMQEFIASTCHLHRLVESAPLAIVRPHRHILPAAATMHFRKVVIMAEVAASCCCQEELALDSFALLVRTGSACLLVVLVALITTIISSEEAHGSWQQKEGQRRDPSMRLCSAGLLELSTTRTGLNICFATTL